MSIVVTCDACGRVLEQLAERVHHASLTLRVSDCGKESPRFYRRRRKNTFSQRVVEVRCGYCRERGER